MKLDGSSRFPHPMLSADTADYGTDTYAVQISWEEDFAEGKLRLVCLTDLSCEGLAGLAASSKAASHLFVACPDTYYREIHRVDAGGRVELPLDAFYGAVEIQPLIVAVLDVPDYTCATLSPEFPVPSHLRTGDVLAYAPPIVINIGRRKLQRFESIFQLAVDPEIVDGRMEVDLDEDKIQILVSAALKEEIEGLRLTQGGQRHLLAAVYLPAVMEVLANLSGNASAWDGKPWKEVFRAKCENLQINLETSDSPLRDAQKLLRMPLSLALQSISKELS